MRIRTMRGRIIARLAGLLPAALFLLGVRALATDLELSLEQAIRMALSPDGNRGVSAAQASLDEAEASARISRAELLPQIRAQVGQSRFTRNLEAQGLRAQSGGFSPPRMVGPLSAFDARVELRQKLLDWSAIKGYQASKASTDTAEQELERVRDRIAAEVARIYLEALRTRADLDAAEADVALARSLFDLARRRRSAGTGLRIEETRAQVQLADQRQRRLAAQNRHLRAVLRLQKTIGAEIGRPIRLTDRLESEPQPDPNPQQALQTAWAARTDYLAQQRRVRTAELRSRQAWAERLPSISGFADYGSSGIEPDDNIPTWTLGVTLEIPIFQGGRLPARREQQAAQLRRQRELLEDLRQQIELEVRLALTGVRLAAQQVTVAREGLTLSQDELQRAQRRYRAGVVGSIEVTDAQTRLERARENLNSALFEHGITQVELEEAMGTIRERIP